MARAQQASTGLKTVSSVRSAVAGTHNWSAGLAAGVATDTHDFDTIFGGRRGSATAQARRDADERDHTIQGFIDKAYALGFSGERAQLIHTMLRAYTETEEGKRSATDRDLLVEDLVDACYLGHIRELAIIADLEDPVGWPGLTAPAVEAIGSYFAALASEADYLSATSWPEPLNDIDCVLNTCFTFQLRDQARLQRLRPLCEGMGQLLTRLVAPAGGEAGVGYKALLVLQDVSEESMTGPLASWVTAFEKRLKAQALSDSEVGALHVILAVQVKNTGAPWPVFKSLAKSMGWRRANRR